MASQSSQISSSNFDNRDLNKEPSTTVSPNSANEVVSQENTTELNGPLIRPVSLNAPHNSTQFIMDNHETSSLFLNFDEEPNAARQNFCESSPFQPQDYFPYNVENYKYEYRNAVEEELRNLSENELREKFIKLDKQRQKYSRQLERTPNKILSTLQARLLSLQEEKKKLIRERREIRYGPYLSDSDAENNARSSSSPKQDVEHFPSSPPNDIEEQMNRARKTFDGAVPHGRLIRPVSLNAPFNSTQFIMDNHETSSLFLNFDEESSTACQKSPFQPQDYFPYCVENYKRDYRTAVENDLRNLSEGELREKIVKLDKLRHKYKKELASTIPSKIMAQLQQKLIALQVEHQDLVNDRKAMSGTLQTSTSTSSSDSESDSSFSSDQSQTMDVEMENGHN